MPDAKFLEEYQLYRKYNWDSDKIAKAYEFFGLSIQDFPDVNINMHCSNCGEPRTFRLTHKYLHKEKPSVRTKVNQPISHSPVTLRENDIIHLNYICASCEKFNRIFSIRIGEEAQYIEKVGQYPAWDINIKKKLLKLLGEYSENYKKGKTCESQSWGIGAFAYYRRIVEDIIGELLETLQNLMIGEELEKYQEVLEEVRNTKNTTKKIALVKDILPPILKPEQFNPLKTIHDALSKGLHGRTDEECLEDADSIRTSLIFLVDAILSRKKGQEEYTESMKKIIGKQRKKIKGENK